MAGKKNVEKKRIDPETRYRERFRMIKMKESLDSLADVCFGRNASVLPHITNSKGEISKNRCKITK